MELALEGATKSAKEKAEYLQNKIMEALDGFGSGKKRSMRNSTYTKLSSIILSGLVTILLGLQTTGFELYFRNAALVLGAIVTMLNGIELFYNYRTLWVEQEIAISSLWRLKDDLDFYLAGSNSEALSIEKLQELMNRYKNIWDDFNQNKTRTRKEGTK